MLSFPQLNHHIDHIATAIADQGYVIIPEFLPNDFINSLRQEALALQESGKLKRASIGKADQNKQDAKVRGDMIHWLDHAQSTDIQQQFSTCMEALREALNRHLFLGLFELENHFAIYPPGAVYHKHLDQFRGNEDRQVSCILYLNETWQPSYGGHLRLYLNNTASEPYLDIPPAGGTLVVFLSGKFWHEVFPATHPRISLTGWFRKRNNVI